MVVDYEKKNVNSVRETGVTRVLPHKSRFHSMHMPARTDRSTRAGMLRMLIV